jgi:extracellular elastinolytic metalloproteinase
VFPLSNIISSFPNLFKNQNMKKSPTKTSSCASKQLWLVVIINLFFATQTWAQAKNGDPSVIALDYLKQNAKNWQLSKTDIADAAVQQMYRSDNNGVTHVWLIQRRDGIEVYNGLVNVNILPSGEVFFAGNRFISNLQTNANQPLISAANAIETVATYLGMAAPKNLQPIASDNKMQFTFAPSGIAFQDMHVKLRYQPIGTDGKARLAWDLDMDAVNGNDHWSIRVDALTGAILDKTSWTVHCNFDHQDAEHAADNAHSDAVLPQKSLSEVIGGPLSINGFFSTKNAQNAFETRENALNTTALSPNTVESLVLDEGKYRILPIPNESPLHGAFSVVQGVVDSLPSPYGWHDTTGTVGADFTITRGNNVHAYLDLRNYNRSSGDEPDGGALLNFDFPYNSQAQSDTQRNLTSKRAIFKQTTTDVVVWAAIL